MSLRIRMAEVGYRSARAFVSMQVCVLMPLMKWKLEPITQTRGTAAGSRRGSSSAEC